MSINTEPLSIVNVDAQFCSDWLKDEIRRVLTALKEATEALEWYGDAQKAVLEFGCGCCAGTLDADGIIDCNPSVQGDHARHALAKIKERGCGE